jgi:hypothetical protein
MSSHPREVFNLYVYFCLQYQVTCINTTIEVLLPIPGRSVQENKVKCYKRPIASGF